MYSTTHSAVKALLHNQRVILYYNRNHITSPYPFSLDFVLKILFSLFIYLPWTSCFDLFSDSATLQNYKFFWLIYVDMKFKFFLEVKNSVWEWDEVGFVFNTE